MNGTNLTFLLDTNAAIAVLAHDDALFSILDNASDIFVSTITLGELSFGAAKSGRPEQNRLQVANLAEAVAVLTPDSTTAWSFGEIKYNLRVKGRPIPDHDIWIGALAIQHQLTLITRDAHFEEIDKLILKAW